MPASKTIDYIKGPILHLSPILTALLLIILLNTTNPLDLGPAGILLILIIFYLFVASSLHLLLSLLFRIGKTFGIKKQVNPSKYYYLTSVLALWPLLLLAINSLGQLNIGEILLITILILIASVYVIRR